LGLHGAGNTAEIHEAFSQLSPIADREGFIAVYPNATPLNKGQVWNSTSARSRADDVGFISTLIDTLSQEYAIDPNRVYVFGNSNGAFMAHHLGARLPYKIAAIASCAGLLAYGDFMEGPPVSVILFHGDNDNTVPYEGYPEYGYPGAEGSAALWAQWNGCDPEPEIIRDDAMTLAWQWSAPEGYGDVVLYRVKGLEHTIPYPWTRTFMQGRPPGRSLARIPR
jgi:polyhydroxybutyrate depolymerase